MIELFDAGVAGDGGKPMNTAEFDRLPLADDAALFEGARVTTAEFCGQRWIAEGTTVIAQLSHPPYPAQVIALVRHNRQNVNIRPEKPSGRCGWCLTRSP